MIERSPSPTPAGGTSSGLDSVACPSETACLAVGGSFDTFGNPVAAIAEHWTSLSWTTTHVPVPSGAQGANLSSVACTSPSWCTAVGSWTTRSSRALTLVERWNGTRWRMGHSPSPAGPNSSLNGVSCVSPSNCTAVGGYAGAAGFFVPFAEHWNGDTWALQRPTNPDPTSDTVLVAVSCTSRACTAAGGAGSTTLAEHLNGINWRVIPTNDPSGGQGSFFNSITCSAPAHCTAVGLDLSNGPRTLAEVWNGSSWTHQPTPTIPGVYDLDPPAIACASTSNCLLVGGYTNNGPKVTLAEGWPAEAATTTAVQPTRTRSASPLGRAWQTGRPPANR